MRQGVENIRRVLHMADMIDYREGMKAWKNYRRTMQGLARFYGFRLKEVTAVFACLSPNNEYISNLRSTVTVLRGVNEGVPVEAISVSTYRQNAFRAYEFAKGARFLRTDTNHKIFNFYKNILFPNDPSFVTVDGHMLNLWRAAKRERLTLAKVEGARLYNIIAEDFFEVAAIEDLLANQVQAICWNVWKRINNIAFRRQLSLLDRDNQWRCYVAPELIDPFPIARKPNVVTLEAWNWLEREKHERKRLANSQAFKRTA